MATPILQEKDYSRAVIGAMKTCTKCGETKPLDFFPFRTARGQHDTRCRSCRNEISNAWKKRNPEKAKATNERTRRLRHERLRRQTIDAYGGQCNCCGEKDLHFLTIEHKNGVPERHRQKDGRRVSGTKLLYLLREEGYPDDCTVLCWNCNCSHAYYGFCPHQPHDVEQRRYK